MARSGSILNADERLKFRMWFQIEAVRLGIAPRGVNRYVKNENYKRGKKAAILSKLGYDSTQQLDRYIQGDSEPTPATLRKLCLVLGLPWLVAALLMGYMDDVFNTLQALYELGIKWCEDDKLYCEPGAGIRLRPGQHVANKDRYFRISRGDWSLNTVSSRPNDFAVPNPIAIAIVIATAYFPLRNEQPMKEGYWQDIIRVCSPTIDAANELFYAGPGRKPLDSRLKKATSALKDTKIRSRARWIAGEYVSAWLEHVSKPVATYSTLALHRQLQAGGYDLSSTIRPLPSAEELSSGLTVETKMIS